MVFSEVRLANFGDGPNTTFVKYLIIIYPCIELISLIQLGIETSPFWVLAYVIGMIFFGLRLIRRQGLALISELKKIERERGIFSILQADDLRIVIAGLLFLIPGLISDVFALMLLIGPIHRHLIMKFQGRINHVRHNGNGETGFVIDGSFTRIDDGSPKNN
ncbi:MAG: FxsA family protein [Halieaceae bacterium]|nr:FxsA family protein [Halieaceae bacterium]